MKKSLDSEQTMLDYVIAQLGAWKGRWGEVADGTEISKRTIEKIASGETVDPGVTRIQKLHDYFRAREQAAA